MIPDSDSVDSPVSPEAVGTTPSDCPVAIGSLDDPADLAPPLETSAPPVDASPAESVSRPPRTRSARTSAPEWPGPTPELLRGIAVRLGVDVETPHWRGDLAKVLATGDVLRVRRENTPVLRYLLGHPQALKPEIVKATGRPPRTVNRIVLEWRNFMGMPLPPVGRPAGEKKKRAPRPRKPKVRAVQPAAPEAAP